MGLIETCGDPKKAWQTWLHYATDESVAKMAARGGYTPEQLIQAIEREGDAVVIRVEGKPDEYLDVINVRTLEPLPDSPTLERLYNNSERSFYDYAMTTREESLRVRRELNTIT